MRLIDAEALRSNVYKLGDVVSIFSVLEEIDNAPIVDISVIGNEDFTPEDFENLECVLMSAIYSCQSSIAVLKHSSPEDNYKRDQLALNEKNLQDYTALLKKIRGIAEQKGEHS